MAKSLRSKKKRKMRAEKRIVNAKKELVKLREVAARLHGDKNLTKETLESSIPDVQVVNTPMSIDNDEVSLTCSATSRRKQAMQINNQWMNQKRIKSIKSRIKKHNTKKARRGGSAKLSSRKAKR